jgi:hypothetical protein
MAHFTVGRILLEDTVANIDLHFAHQLIARLDTSAASYINDLLTGALWCRPGQSGH